MADTAKKPPESMVDRFRNFVTGGASKVAQDAAQPKAQPSDTMHPLPMKHADEGISHVNMNYFHDDDGK